MSAPLGNVLGPCAGNKCAGKTADVQIAVAFLRRVGQGDYVVNPANITPDVGGCFKTGPLAIPMVYPNFIDPLYLVETVDWSYFTAALIIGERIVTTTFDPVNQDMTRTDVIKSGSFVNIGPGTFAVINGYPVLFSSNDFSNTFFAPTAPNNTATDTWTYDNSSPWTYTQGVGAVTFIKAPYDDPPVGGNITHHIGTKVVLTLTVPFGFAGYVVICDAMLARLTLQDGTLNPGKTYPAIDPFNGSVPRNVFFRYYGEFPNTGPNTPSKSYASTLSVIYSRPLGYTFGCYLDCEYLSGGGMYSPAAFFDQALSVVYNPVTGRYTFNEMVIPLAASGQPCTLTNDPTTFFVQSWALLSGGSGYTNGDILAPVGVGTEANFRANVGAGGTITSLTLLTIGGYIPPLPASPCLLSGGTGAGAEVSLVFYCGQISQFILFPSGSATPTTDSVAWICSIKSSVRTRSSLAASGKQWVFNPATNSYAQSPAAGLPSAGGEFELDPSLVSGQGWLSAIWNTLTEITVGQSIGAGPAQQQCDFVHGPSPQTATLYASGFDKYGNYIALYQSTWSLTNITGAFLASDLVPSADGTTATLTVRSGVIGTCQVQALAGGVACVNLPVIVS